MDGVVRAYRQEGAAGDEVFNMCSRVKIVCWCYDEFVTLREGGAVGKELILV